MEDQKAVVKREPINIELERGITPKNYNELLQISALLFKSGLAPKSLDTLEKTTIAVLMCLELGRPVAVGIQDIAVINGKAGLFGDAALAIIRSSGLLEKFKEWEEGTPYTDDWTFYCEVKRKGMPDSRKGTWSWRDSIRAGFDKMSPPSPWARYTRRMMQFKCRNFPLRDEFGDVLKGMRLSEDNMDAIDLVPDDSGSYEKPQENDETTSPPRAAAVSKKVVDFKKFMAKSHLPHDMVDRFVKETAEKNEVPVEYVMKEALNDTRAFTLAAKVWIAGQSDQSPPPPTPPDEVAEVTLFDEFKAMRPNSSKQNRLLFRRMVLENLNEIREWPEKDLEWMATVKWPNTFPDEVFNDVLNPPGDEVDAEFEEDQPEESKEEERPPEPPDTFADEPFGATEGKREPPWERRKRFLDDMKDLFLKNDTVYRTVLGAQGYETAKEVPEDPEQEKAVLSIMRSEIPGV